MIAAALIAFREGLEAALIVGIVFGYLKKTGQQAHYRYAWAGVLAAIGLSLALALGIQAIGMELQGPAEQLFEGITMFLAVGILTWMIFWMRYQSRTLKSTLEHDLQRALSPISGVGYWPRPSWPYSGKELRRPCSCPPPPSPPADRQR